MAATPIVETCLIRPSTRVQGCDSVLVHLTLVGALLFAYGSPSIAAVAEIVPPKEMPKIPAVIDTKAACLS